MKKLILICIALITISSVNAQDGPTYFTGETCYCIMVVANPNHTTRQKTMVRTPIIEVPCTTWAGGLKDDLKKQYFFFLHKNYRPKLEIFKGDKSVTQGMLRAFVKNTKEEVKTEMEGMYRIGSDSWKRSKYTVISTDDFKYEKGKYYSNNYPGNELFLIFKQIDNYFKGVEID